MSSVLGSDFPGEMEDRSGPTGGRRWLHAEMIGLSHVSLRKVVVVFFYMS